jgi:tetratricopeptide (TPR) repeat protein
VDSEIYTSHITELSGDRRGWDWSGLHESGGLHPFYQDYLVAAGRVNELIAKELKDVPDHPSYLDDYWRGLHAYFGRRYDLSIQLYREALELNPGFTAAHLGLSRAYAQMNEYEGAVREARAASQMPRSSGALGYALAVRGRQREARALLTELTTRTRTEYVTPINFAWISIGLGAKDDALKWLRLACETKVEETAYVKADPIYDTLRNDPRFSDIVQCVGLEH